MKNCFSTPKFTYILRTAPVFELKECLRNLDAITLSCVSSITNVDFSDLSYRQASLSTRFGGLGIRRFLDLALPAYLASLHSTSDLVNSILSHSTDLPSTDLVPKLLQVWQDEGLPLPEKECFGHQKSWDSILQTKMYGNLLESANQVAKARLLAAKCSESGAWLNAFPIASLGTHLQDNAFRIAIAQRVGAVVCVPHKCRCGGMVDSCGLHPLSCRYNSGRAPRHSEVNDILRRAFLSAGIPSVLEPTGLSRNDGKRPDGMTTFPVQCGKSIVWDFTCVDTFAASNLINSSIDPGSAATTAEASKKRKYESLIGQHQFEPVAIETSGVYGTSTRCFVQYLGRRITEVTGEPRETFWLKQRIGIAVARGNALSVCLAAAKKADY